MAEVDPKVLERLTRWGPMEPEPAPVVEAPQTDPKVAQRLVRWEPMPAAPEPPPTGLPALDVEVMRRMTAWSPTPAVVEPAALAVTGGVPISDLPPVPQLVTGAEDIPLVQMGTTYRATLTQAIENLVGEGVGSPGPPGPAGPPGAPGPAGAQGPPGPNAVSSDPFNAATLGSDDLIFVQSGAGGTGGIPEAPQNNIGYGRANATWTPVLRLTGDVLDGGNF